MIEITSRLPSDYQEVEYLESTGTQYIDTGVKGKTGLKASGAIMLTASQTCIALGCYSPQRCYMLSFNSNVPRYGYVDWYTAIAAVTVNEKYNFEVSFEKSAQYLKLNGTTVISSANATTFTNNYNIFAFAYSDGGSAGDFAKCRFYSLNLYDNGTLIREFVPCYRKSNNVAGFYDLLNDAFYTNQGTGSFVVGADVGGTVITSGGVILKKYALRRRMMMAGGGGAPISDLPLGALLNVGTDGGAGTPNYEIADKDNLVNGGVVLVRKNIHSKSAFGSSATYPGGTLDNLINTTIYNEMPQQLRDKMMDVSFNLSGSGNITRKMFALSYTMAGFGGSEGKALQLYTSNASRVKTFNGSAAVWWLSSQYSSDRAWYVLPDGSAIALSGLSNSYGVVPAFVIPSKTPYDPTPNTDGSYNLIL